MRTLGMTNPEETALVDRHIAEVAALVDQQRRRVKALRSAGRNTALARGVLDLLVETISLMRLQRETIRN